MGEARGVKLDLVDHGKAKPDIQPKMANFDHLWLPKKLQWQGPGDQEAKSSIWPIATRAFTL